ncbi:DNA polymerase II large subunit [Candidatus Pacearchaeota archaeon CG10_big_fil_rev_8_21_14_0_10_35_13]|nr:MAG: DNA polymerase II large subunit [Candidatus Pacearchaeota archaeon CG10_big_fil_rev_8_21_14_0_10_35_13]
MEIETYFKEIQEGVDKAYEIAKQARSMGLDPVDKVEIKLATTLAEKSVGLIATLYPQMEGTGIVERILELEKQYGQLSQEVSFKIAEEVAKETFCKFKDQLQAIDAGVRIGFAYNTLGVVSSPIEGYTMLKTGKNPDGGEYFKPYFSGPIRSAGTTASCMALILVDYLRETFGYAKYQPTKEEIKRVVTELYDYHERVTNLQYLPTEEEATFLATHLPIQVAGEPTEEREVSNYKDLPRVETNRIRGGFCLIMGEGLAQKAAKGLRMLKKLQASGFKISDWGFLDDYVELHNKRDQGKKDSSPTYIKDLVAGRPVFGHPSRSGAFRFRYGRTRTGGFSAASIHPATMAIMAGFIATGTQLKIEKPTKGCITTVCDSIEGPIIKLFNGSVKKLKTVEEAKNYYKDTEEIIYSGDILFPIGDVMNRNYELVMPGYVEEWWNIEIRNKNPEEKDKEVIKQEDISLEQAVALSEKYDVPLHPKYIYYWTQIDYNALCSLIYWIENSRIDKKLILPYNTQEQTEYAEGKRALELLGITHEVITENVVLKSEDSKALLISLGVLPDVFDNDKYSLKEDMKELKKKLNPEKKVLEIINELSYVKIKDKAGTFVGTRMGRPEKAKLRKLVGSPNVLFPVGEEGGRFRSVNEAAEKESIKAEYPNYYCEKCDKETIYGTCEECGEKAKKKYYCYDCKEMIEGEKCEQEGHERIMGHGNRRIDSKHYLRSAAKLIGMLPQEIPPLIKGVRGTSNEEHIIENLAKGLLRAQFNIAVNKDGTVRYDATEIPITHFKPKEVGTSPERLKELGYEKDIHGKELVDEEQVLEIKPHDIILPACPETKDEKATDVFVNVAKFVDSLLVRMYKQKPYYNITRKEQLVGQLVACMSPHNCAGVVGRIIGSSKTQGLLASPYIHAAMRRDCVFPTTKFVYSDNKGVVNYERIGEYVEGLIKGGMKTKILDSIGTLRVETDKELYAYGADPKTKELVKKKIKYFIKGLQTKKWVKIKTSTNREFTMTPTHEFMYLDEENNHQFKKAHKCKVGDKLLVSDYFKPELVYQDYNLDLIKEFIENVEEEILTKIRIKESKNFLKKLVKEIGKTKLLETCTLNNYERMNLHSWYDSASLLNIKELIEQDLLDYEELPRETKLGFLFSNYKLDRYLKIDNKLARLLGFFTSEGHLRTNKTTKQVSFRNSNKEIGEEITKLTKEILNVNVIIEEENTKYTISNSLIYYLFKEVLRTGANAKDKKVPRILFNCDNEIIANYISTYIDGDGSIIPQRKAVVFYSKKKELLDEIAFLLTRFGLIGRYAYIEPRLPGRTVLEKYEKKGMIKKFGLNHLIFHGVDAVKLINILKLAHNKKKKNSEMIVSMNIKKRRLNNKELHSFGDSFIDYIKEVSLVEEEEHSYCLEVEWNKKEERNIIWGEQIINTRCDGDEAAIMLLLDVLINFSRKFLPAHRGGTQDAPLVLNSRLRAGEVDDQILDFDIIKENPIEIYEMAEKGEHSSALKNIETVKTRLKNGTDPFSNIGYTHETDDINGGLVNSSYKSLPTMKDKVAKQMELVEKLRAVDESDVARLIIERHFIRDIRGNLRKFSQQQFRCVGCNEKYRRPPMAGKCSKCGGKIIFTISEGSIIKYLEPAIELAEKYAVSPYVRQSLHLARSYIESIFGKEKEKQVELKGWF